MPIFFITKTAYEALRDAVYRKYGTRRGLRAAIHHEASVAVEAHARLLDRTATMRAALAAARRPAGDATPKCH